ncbi:MAG: hypothetical protein OXI26_04025 [bacterium]|nr:hypothetical protein [bacterium]
MAIPPKALTAHSADIPGDALTCVVSDMPRLAVVSQTCDIVRPCQERPYLLVAPVVTLGERDAGEARRGSRPRFVALPGVGNQDFVDLDRVMTVEKSIVLTSTPIRGLPDEASQRRFGAGVARSFSRFAFPDDLSASLRGLVKHIRSKHDRDSLGGRALRIVKEIRVTGSPSWDAAEINAFVSFCPATLEEATSLMTEEEWDVLVDEWIGRAKPYGVIQSVDGAMIPLDRMRARDYLDSDPLDLDYLSWSSASDD